MDLLPQRAARACWRSGWRWVLMPNLREASAARRFDRRGLRAGRIVPLPADGGRSSWSAATCAGLDWHGAVAAGWTWHSAGWRCATAGAPEPTAARPRVSCASPTFRAVTVTGGTIFRVTIGTVPFLLPLLFQIGFGLDAFQCRAARAGDVPGQHRHEAGHHLGDAPLGVPRHRPRHRGCSSSLTMAGLRGADAGHAAGRCCWPVLFNSGLTRSMQFTVLNTLELRRRAAATDEQRLHPRPAWRSRCRSAWAWRSGAAPAAPGGGCGMAGRRCWRIFTWCSSVVAVLMLGGLAALSAPFAARRRRGGERPPAGLSIRHAGRRAFSAAPSVPSSSTSNAPPIGTPWPTRETTTPAESATVQPASAPCWRLPRLRRGRGSPPPRRPPRPAPSSGRRLRSSGPTPPRADSVPPSTW